MFPINRKLPRLSTLCLLVTVCLSAWLALGRPTTQPQPANAAIQATSPATATTPQAASRVKPISEAQLGERTIGKNPLREQVDADLVEPDPATWRKLTLRMPKDNGRWLTVELLRSLDWIEAEAAAVGETIFLDLADMGAFGDAEVVSIDPCPPIQPGTGNVITGRFIHEVEPGEVIELRFSGQPEATRVTKNHPYWSVDREDFIPAGELREGETVDCLNGSGTTTVASITPSDYSGLVYNLEIHGEHVYRVGSSGLLAHNACAGQHHMIPRSWGARIPYRHVSLPRLTEQQHTHIHTAFSDFLENKFKRRFMSQSGSDWQRTLGSKERAVEVTQQFVNWYTRQFPQQAKSIKDSTRQSVRQWFNQQLRVLEEHPEFWNWDP
jgi:hypothetical protein